MSGNQRETVIDMPSAERSRAEGESTNGHADPGANGYPRNGADHTQGHARATNDANRANHQGPKELPRYTQSTRRRSYEEEESPETSRDEIKLPFDPWRLFIAVRDHRRWLLLAAVIVGALFFFVGQRAFKYKASVHLIRRQVIDPLAANSNDPARQQISDQTLFTFMRSGEVLRRVATRAAQANPPIQITAEELSGLVNVLPTPIPDILTLQVAGHERSQRLADLANIYADEVVQYTREMQSSESGDVATYLEQRVQTSEQEWRAASDEFQQFQKQSGIFNLDKEAEALALQISNYELKLQSARVDLNTARLQRSGLEKDISKQSPRNEKLRTAREDLSALLLKYTEAHPFVIEQRKKIEMLSKQDPSITEDGTQMGVNSIGNALHMQTVDLRNKEAAFEQQVKEYQRLYDEAKQKLRNLSESNSKFVALKAKVTAADATRSLLSERQRDKRLYVQNAMGYYRRYGEASTKDIDWKRRAVKITGLTLFGAFAGVCMAMLVAFYREITDTSLKTVADVGRVTGLKVFATLKRFKKFDEDSPEIKNWAFKTLTTLRGKLCVNNEQALVFGIISARPGEGRSSWIKALAMAAAQQGLKVEICDPTREMPMRPKEADIPKATEKPEKGPIITPPPPGSEAEAKKFALTTIPSESRALVPISDLAWTVEGRERWKEELAQRTIEKHTVVLVDLPPASHNDAVLLAQEIPQIIWLTGSGMDDVEETRERLETLRNAHCNIVGAVLNFAPPPPLNNRLARWFRKGTAMIIFALGLCGAAQAQEQKLAFSGANEIKRAKWQERLTLGPGDSMDVSLYGHPELTRTNIFVGPDGRISYLQVQGLKVEGMTVEELRAKMDEELAKYFNAARTIVIPTAFNSKKYYVLGKVMSKGVYSLDRPMTVIEAVARAQGLETGLYERTSIEMADLSRSFLIRNGERQQLDFEKLFYDGDLAQNIMIEPNDFLFFGAAGASEIYVLGHVMNPGPVGYIPSATLLTAITDRGGFTDRAHRAKVLVVRGSLNKPETFVIDTKEILNAAKPDFKLQSKDIIYVAQRPWIRAEELLDEATQSFIQGFVTAFSGAKIGPFIKNPIFGD